MNRVENGPVRFPDDWAGVFIRGDNELHYAMLVKHAVEATKSNSILSMQLNGLSDLLMSCREPCDRAVEVSIDEAAL